MSDGGTTVYYFMGKCKWAKVHEPDKKYGNYTIDMYLDEPSWKAFKKSKLGLKVREDEDGEKFVTFRLSKERKVKGELKAQRPAVLDADGNPTDVLIGNGSDVTVKVDVYEWDGKYGHRLQAVRIDNLVKFNKKEVSEDTPVDVPF